MNILILKSKEQKSPEKPFTVKMNTTYAERVIKHLSGSNDLCSGCGENCIKCRNLYNLNFSESIAGIVEFPSELPAILEKPELYLPEKVPAHDLLIAISINEELLISFINKFPYSRGVIVPLEERGWISPHAVELIKGICRKKGVEVCFPKPFCSFSPDKKQPLLFEFRKKFRIGKPEVSIKFRGKIITEVKVNCSAPCGATYYTARCMVGKELSRELVFTIDKALSSYPCTAGRELDPQFGDSITHRAVKIQRDILKNFSVTVNY